jgi:hypothetical protein
MAEPETPLGGSAYDSLFLNANHFPDSKDMVVTDNGDVYVLVVCRVTGSNYAVRFYKYDAGAGTWSTVNGDVWGLGNPNVTGRSAWTAALATDGQDVWLAFNQKLTTSGGGVASNLDTKWRCFFYDTSANTFTELGTGQSYYNSVPREDGPLNDVLLDGGFDTRVHLAVSPAGKLWAAWPELNPDRLYTVSSFSGGSANLTGGTDGFTGALDGSNPAARDGSGSAVGTAAGESGSYFTPQFGDEVPLPVSGRAQAVIEIGAMPTGGDWIAFDWYITGAGTGSRTFYRIKVTSAGNAVIWERVNAGTVTTLMTYTLPITLVAGDRLAILQQGATLDLRYYRSSTTAWQFAGSSGTDASPLTAVAVSGIEFNGTSGKWSFLRAGGTGQDERACVAYWDTGSSAWVMTDLELIPGGYRRNQGGNQTVGTVKNAFNEKHVQLAFVQHDGPSEDPTVMFTTEHTSPGMVSGLEDEELLWHFAEYDGGSSSWGGCVNQNTVAIWGSALYETSNTAPFYYASNGFPQGFTLLKAEGRPFLVANVVTHTGSVDLVGGAVMATDGSGFFAEAVGNPDDVIRVFPKSPGNGPWYGWVGCLAAEDSRGQIFMWNDRNDDQFAAWLLMRAVNGGDIGTGSQWAVGATLNNRLWYMEGDSNDAMFIGADDSVYVLTDMYATSIRNGSYVYKWDPSGVVAVSVFVPQIYRRH